MCFGQKITADAEFFVPSATLECGQTFRFYKNGEEDYTVAASDRRCRLYMRGGSTIVECDDVGFFENYFDLKTDYRAITEKLAAFPELTEAVNVGKGIRILRQDPFETIISFIISANNNIPRIKGIIERLCDNFGLTIDCGGHAFPTPDALSKVQKETFRMLGAGFRDRYLYETAQVLSGTDFLDRLLRADTQTATKMLLSLKGVGQKVADCILLFGLRHTDCYPVDTWIFKSNRTAELDTPEKVRKFYLNRYGNLAGYAQQYIFYAARG